MYLTWGQYNQPKKNQETRHGSKPRSMGRRDLKLNLCLKQRPRLMLCCSKADRGILIGRLLQVNRYLHIGPPISTAPRVASTFAGRGAASAASIIVGWTWGRFSFFLWLNGQKNGPTDKKVDLNGQKSYQRNKKCPLVHYFCPLVQYFCPLGS